MEPNKGQFDNVVSLDDMRAKSQASKSPYGPVQSGIVKVQPQSIKEDDK